MLTAPARPSPVLASCDPFLRLYQHRDLKLENILIETGRGNNSTPAIKLVDFGLSAIYHENGVSTDILGSWVRSLFREGPSA